MSDNKKLFDQIEAAFDERDFQAMFEYFNDQDVARSFRVDFQSELALIETRKLDPIIAFSTLEYAFFGWDSPWKDREQLVDSGGSEAHMFLVKLALHYFRQIVRADRGLPALTNEQFQEWMAREPRPDLPITKVHSDLPRPRVLTQIWHTDEEHQEIAKLVAKHFPEEVAYIRAVCKETEFGGGVWPIGCLEGPVRRIDAVEAHLFPDKKPGEFWLECGEIRDILTSGNGE